MCDNSESKSPENTEASSCKTSDKESLDDEDDIEEMRQYICQKIAQYLPDSENQTSELDPCLYETVKTYNLY